ncbi:hypothetical protein BGW80DRAFT_1409680, partial [Lactifluus volemus]
MNSAEQILHDRVNLVRLVRRLEKSVNESDWESERNITLWLKSQGILQQLKHARKLLSGVELYNETQPSATLKRRLDDIRGLLDKLDAFMLSVNKDHPEITSSRPFLDAVPLPPLSARKADLPVFQRIAPTSDVTSGPNADVFRSTEEESSLLPLEPHSTLQLSRPVPLSSTTADGTPTQALLQHRTVLQEELSAQLAQMAGQLRRNAEHFSSALAADQAVLRNTEEKIGANFD